MPETQETQDRLARIESELSEVKSLTRLSVASSPELKDHVEAVFKARAKAPEVFVALADAPLTQDELQAKLGMSHGTISIVCNYLADHDLIRKTDQGGRKNVYFWTEGAKLVGAFKIASKCTKG